MSAMPHTKRHPDNSNLTKFEGGWYQSMPVYTAGGPLIENYLARSHRVMSASLNCHPRITAIRFDLRLPSGSDWADDDNRLLGVFWDKLKNEIARDRRKAKRDNPKAHDTKVHYLWAREYDQSGGQPHWHCLLLVNKDAYYELGFFKSGNSNMYHRIASAWCSALGESVGQFEALVEVPNNPVYHIDRHDRNDAYADLFFRVSYFAKMKTKKYHGNVNAFGGSHIGC